MPRVAVARIIEQFQALDGDSQADVMRQLRRLAYGLPAEPRRPGRVFHIVPRQRPVGLSPTTDISLTLDARSLTYLGYREYTPGTMVIPSADLLYRQLGDVVPEIAEQFDRAAWHAEHAQEVQRLTYTLRGYRRRADLMVRDQKVLISVTHLGVATEGPPAIRLVDAVSRAEVTEALKELSRHLDLPDDE